MSRTPESGSPITHDQVIPNQYSRLKRVRQIAINGLYSAKQILLEGVVAPLTEPEPANYINLSLNEKQSLVIDTSTELGFGLNRISVFTKNSSALSEIHPNFFVVVTENSKPVLDVNRLAPQNDNIGTIVGNLANKKAYERLIQIDPAYKGFCTLHSGKYVVNLYYANEEGRRQKLEPVELGLFSKLTVAPIKGFARYTPILEVDLEKVDLEEEIKEDSNLEVDLEKVDLEEEIKEDSNLEVDLEKVDSKKDYKGIIMTFKSTSPDQIENRNSTN